jgi:hypothetical protein
VAHFGPRIFDWIEAVSVEHPGGGIFLEDEQAATAVIAATKKPTEASLIRRLVSAARPIGSSFFQLPTKLRPTSFVDHAVNRAVWDAKGIDGKLAFRRLPL